MMRIILLLAVLLFPASPVFAQVIKMNHGLVQSSMSSNQFDILNDNVTTYSLQLGIDYWEHKYVYLSSEAGYLRTGGFESNPFLSEHFAEVSEYWDYLHLNTTARFRLPLPGDAHLFAGAGPKLDVLVGSGRFKSELYADYAEGYQKNRFSFGGKAETGIVQDINRVRVGVNISRFFDTGNAGGTDYIDLKNNSFAFVLSFGYRIHSANSDQ